MLNFDPTSSTQAAERQRRQNADEKNRVNRISDAVALRENNLRTVAEAPPEAEVERFRALMGGANKPLEKGNSKPSQTGVQSSAGDASEKREAPASNGVANRNAASVADRYRAMLMLASTPGEEAPRQSASQGDASSGKPAGQPPTELKNPGSDKNIAGADERANSDGQTRVADAARDQNRVDGDTMGKLATDDGKSRLGAKSDAAKDKDSGALERKAATGDTQALVATRRKSHGDDDVGNGANHQDSAATSMPASFNPMAPAQQMAQPAARQASTPAAGMITPQLVELIRNNVKQMLVSDGRSSRLRSREMLLRMQDDTLPGTDLWLTRTDDGWHLRADISSREGYEMLMAAKDELIQRFADQALGELSVEPIYHDG